MDNSQVLVIVLILVVLWVAYQSQKKPKLNKFTQTEPITKSSQETQAGTKEKAQIRTEPTNRQELAQQKATIKDLKKEIKRLSEENDQQAKKINQLEQQKKARDQAEKERKEALRKRIAEYRTVKKKEEGKSELEDTGLDYQSNGERERERENKTQN
jgi:TolA-binding protein